MTIAEYLIKSINSGYIRSDRKSRIKGMGEEWEFIPDRKYGPGILKNVITGSILSVAEISDREIDLNNNDWEVIK